MITTTSEPAKRGSLWQVIKMKQILLLRLVREQDLAHTIENLTQAQTLCLDKRVRDAATQLQDEKILAKLSAGDMIAVDAVYHKTCLATRYNRLRDFNNSRSKEESGHSIIEGIVLAKILDYLRDTHMHSETIPVIKLSDIKALYWKNIWKNMELQWIL